MVVLIMEVALELVVVTILVLLVVLVVIVIVMLVGIVMVGHRGGGCRGDYPCRRDKGGGWSWS